MVALAVLQPDHWADTSVGHGTGGATVERYPYRTDTVSRARLPPPPAASHTSAHTGRLFLCTSHRSAASNDAPVMSASALTRAIDGGAASTHPSGTPPKRSTVANVLASASSRRRSLGLGPPCRCGRRHAA